MYIIHSAHTYTLPFLIHLPFPPASLLPPSCHSTFMFFCFIFAYNPLGLSLGVYIAMDIVSYISVCCSDSYSTFSNFHRQQYKVLVLWSSVSKWEATLIKMGRKRFGGIIPLTTSYSPWVGNSLDLLLTMIIHVSAC